MYEEQKGVIVFEPMPFSVGVSVPLSEEQSAWLAKLRKSPLWYRYAPPHIKDDEVIQLVYQILGQRDFDSRFD
jgi:hypothetical protein